MWWRMSLNNRSIKSCLFFHKRKIEKTRRTLAEPKNAACILMFTEAKKIRRKKYRTFCKSLVTTRRASDNQTQRNTEDTHKKNCFLVVSPFRSLCPFFIVSTCSMSLACLRSIFFYSFFISSVLSLQFVFFLFLSFSVVEKWNKKKSKEMTDSGHQFCQTCDAYSISRCVCVFIAGWCWYQNNRWSINRISCSHRNGKREKKKSSRKCLVWLLHSAQSQATDGNFILFFDRQKSKIIQMRQTRRATSSFHTVAIISLPTSILHWPGTRAFITCCLLWN